jgi:hypothetical protein
MEGGTSSASAGVPQIVSHGKNRFGRNIMKAVTENDLRNVKASIAVGAADLCPRRERVASVAALLRCDEDEAKALIARGRRLARAKKDRAA